MSTQDNQPPENTLPSWAVEVLQRLSSVEAKVDMLITQQSVTKDYFKLVLLAVGAMAALIGVKLALPSV